MKILGLNYIGYNAAATLFINGKLIAAIEEERFTRYEKHTRKFPRKAIEFCLKQGAIDISEIDHVTMSLNPKELIGWKNWKCAFSPWYGIKNKYLIAVGSYYALQCVTLRKRILRYFPNLHKNCQIHFITHHNTHLASTFFVSPFTEADIISIDGVGEWEATVMAQGFNNYIIRKENIEFPNSIGFLYSGITRHLGFKVNNDEYKIMGLAGYGDPKTYIDFLRKVLILTQNGLYKINPSYLAPGLKWGLLSKKFVKECKLPMRHPEDEITDHHKDLAAAIQMITEEVAIHIASALQLKTGSKKLCLSGGVALNSLMNTKILENTNYEDIYIQPASYDASCALGGPLWLYHQILQQPRSYQMKHVYYGYESNETEIVKALNSFGRRIFFRKSKNIVKDTVKEILGQKIIGWYQGKMEWGPRALGNRSIISDPRNARMTNHINDRVKHREDFRPFAPSCKAEKYKEYFSSSIPSPFMLLVCKVKENKRQTIPAVTHFDGTARFHSVEKAINPIYWSLLDEFEKNTGVPVLLNTSFNVKGETIVMTPIDAINCFLGTGIDVLVLSDYIVYKSFE